MSRKQQSKRRTRRVDDEQFKSEAIQLQLGGQSAQSIIERLGISGTILLLYRWKNQPLENAGPNGEVLDSRAQELESQLRRTGTRRVKKSFVHFRTASVTQMYPAV